MADMHTDSDERIEQLVRDKLEGKSYTEIREELRNSGMKPEEISRLIRQVDERVLSEAVDQGSRKRSQQWYRWGLVLAVAGLILTIGYNAGMIKTSLPALAVYSPFLAGILLMFYAKMSQRKSPGNKPQEPGPIRKKRPFK